MTVTVKKTWCLCRRAETERNRFISLRDPNVPRVFGCCFFCLFVYTATPAPCSQRASHLMRGEEVGKRSRFVSPRPQAETCGTEHTIPLSLAVNGHFFQGSWSGSTSIEKPGSLSNNLQIKQCTKTVKNYK